MRSLSLACVSFPLLYISSPDTSGLKRVKADAAREKSVMAEIRGITSRRQLAWIDDIFTDGRQEERSGAFYPRIMRAEDRAEAARVHFASPSFLLTRHEKRWNDSALLKPFDS